nr:hypothetical protein [Tanacetum cinerariifolium]
MDKSGLGSIIHFGANCCYSTCTVVVFELNREAEEESKEARKEKEVKVFRVQKAEKGWGKIESIDAGEGITLVDVETNKEVVAMDAESQGRINQEDINTASKGIAQKLHDEEVQKAAARDKQKKADMKRALELQKQYDDTKENINWSAVAEQVQESHLDNIRKYQNLKKKPVLIAQAKKNMIIYLKNMVGYKMKHFRGMTYDKESFKKLKADEVLGSESTQEIPSNDPKEMTKEDVQNMLEIILVSKFKVEALQVKYPIIDWEIHTEGSRTYWKIIRVGGITEAYQSFKDMLKGFDREDLVSLWNLVKEKFSSAVPSEDKEKALWVELKRLFEPDADDIIRVGGITEAYQSFVDMLKGFDREDLLSLWNLVKEKFSSAVPSEDKEKALWVELKRLFEPDADDVLWKLQIYMHSPLTWKLYTDREVHHVSLKRGHDIFMLIEKDYSLSNVVMILMLSGKIQVEENNEMARHLVIKIFMEANKPKSKSLDTSSM